MVNDTMRRRFLVLLCGATITATSIAALRWQQARHVEAQAAVKTWAPRLIDADRTVRQQALEQLTDAGTLCVPAVLELLEDELQQSRRWGGTTYLKDNGATNHFCAEMPEIFVLAKQLLRSSETTLELEKALAAGLIDDDLQKKAWCEWALERGSVTQPEVFVGLGQHLDEINALKLRHSDVIVRRWAALEYHYHDEASAADLDHVMNDEDQLVRLFAVAKCLHSINKVTERAIVAALSDESALVRAMAVDVLYDWVTGFQVQLKPDAVARLESALQDENKLVRRRALLLTSRIGLLTEEVATLLESVDSEDNLQELLYHEAEAFAAVGYRISPHVLQKESTLLIDEAASTKSKPAVADGL